MIRLRDVPGVQGVEDTERLNANARVSNDHGLSRRIQEVSLRSFGLGVNDLEFEYPDFVLDKEWDDLTDDEIDRVNDAWDAWHKQFELSDDRDAISTWAALGWDITDETGKPMLCLSHFSRQMVLVAKGLKGRPLEDVASDAWATRLKETARVQVSEEQKAKNQRFLNLGANPRAGRAGRRRS